MIRRVIRVLVNRDLEDVNRYSFTHNIMHARNPLEFKLPTLEIYDRKMDPIVRLIKYMRHIEVLRALEEAMA